MNTRCIVLCILLVLWAQIMKSLESAVIVDTTIDYCLDNTRCVRHSDSADPCQYHIDKNLGKSVLYGVRTEVIACKIIQCIALELHRAIGPYWAIPTNCKRDQWTVCLLKAKQYTKSRPQNTVQKISND
eukprot:1148913_1